MERSDRIAVLQELLGTTSSSKSKVRRQRMFFIQVTIQKQREQDKPFEIAGLIVGIFCEYSSLRKKKALQRHKISA